MRVIEQTRRIDAANLQADSEAPDQLPALSQTTRPAPMNDLRLQAELTHPTSIRSTRALYFALAAPQPNSAALQAALTYLRRAVDDSAGAPCALPDDPAGLEAWIAMHTKDVGQQYEQYLAERKAGSARQYFTTRAHALYFLQAVAPTKTVDGAWLYGLLRYWSDSRYQSLIRIYLEELGDGLADKNHVALYRRLLAANGCDDWGHLDDVFFVQGTVQLALARHAEHFLPEIIGFNLGYEQLPLHLLITAYELNELGIDPYYFTLHVTVDNAATGHAMTALRGLQEAWPVLGDGARFYERVRNGFRLGNLGIDTTEIIGNFDLGAEMLAILRRKSSVGRKVHSDYCRVAGRTVNDWLADAADVPAFVAALEQAGWIQRHQDPQHSRFWNLIQGERAEMFGVFSAYEQQVIHDWIAGDAAIAPSASRQLSYKARRRLLHSLAPVPAMRLQPPAVQGAAPGSSDTAEDGLNDMNDDARQLDQLLQQQCSHEARMALLSGLMAPARHHTAVGLQATRRFVRMLG
jgi:hypothetical protein